jgi:uncharacterized protein YndB with AHSA1/START domain
MNNNNNISLSHKYNAAPGKLFLLIQNGVLFKLTGADKIEFDFRENGSFSFKFNDRGHVYGKFKNIIPNEKVVLGWNVTGFGLEDEFDTIVDITINGKGITTLTIKHTGIMSEKSAGAKQIGWSEILEDLEKEIKI